MKQRTRKYHCPFCGCRYYTMRGAGQPMFMDECPHCHNDYACAQKIIVKRRVMQTVVMTIVLALAIVIDKLL